MQILLETTDPYELTTQNNTKDERRADFFLWTGRCSVLIALQASRLVPRDKFGTLGPPTKCRWLAIMGRNWKHHPISHLLCPAPKVLKPYLELIRVGCLYRIWTSAEKGITFWEIHLMKSTVLEIPPSPITNPTFAQKPTNLFYHYCGSNVSSVSSVKIMVEVNHNYFSRVSVWSAYDMAIILLIQFVWKPAFNNQILFSLLRLKAATLSLRSSGKWPEELSRSWVRVTHSNISQLWQMWNLWQI